MAPTWIPRWERTCESINDIPGRSAERKVAAALNEIDSGDVYILHSLRYARHRAVGAATNLEIDFLVVWKHRGFLILEVKGGRIDYDAVENRWWRLPRDQPRREYARSPVKQVEGQKNDFCTEILPRFLSKELNPRCLVERLLVFPDVRLATFNDQSGQKVHRIDDFEMDSIVGMDGMHCLARFVEDKLEACRRYIHGRCVSGSLYDDVIRFLRPSVLAEVPVRHILEESDAQIETATNEQREHLSHVMGVRRLLMEGPAGTAKTVLGLSAVLTWADGGEAAYYITASEFLVAGLKKDVRYNKVKDRIMTIHAFLEMAFSKEIGVRDEDILAGLTEWECPSKGFSIVIDEVQDLDDDLYEALVTLLPCDRLWVLRDNRQSLNRQNDVRRYDVGQMKHAAPYLLTKNCRSVRPISEYIAKYVSLPPEYASLAALPQGTSALQIFVVSSLDEQDDRLLDMVRQEIKNGWNREDMVVISCAADGRDAVRNKYCSTKGKIRFESIFAYGRGTSETIAVYHSLDFRGLEAPCVFVTDIEGQESVFRANYLSGSRAKFRLAIIRVDDPGAIEARNTRIPEGLSFD